MKSQGYGSRAGSWTVHQGVTPMLRGIYETPRPLPQRTSPPIASPFMEARQAAEARQDALRASKRTDEKVRTAIDSQAVIDAYREGCTVQEVAEQFDMTDRAVRYLLHKYDVRLRYRQESELEAKVCEGCGITFIPSATTKPSEWKRRRMCHSGCRRPIDKPKA